MVRKMLKKIESLMIILSVTFFVFCNYASIVSDNDGAAFVTKQEFEELKAGFAEQIDRYNASIDSKIDGSIANYLNGVNLNLTQKILLPYASWKTVTMMNGVINPQFTYPSANLYGSALFNEGEEITTGSHWVKVGSAFISINYSQGSAVSTRPTVTNVIEPTQNTTNMTWNGVATNWKESFVAAITCKANAWTMYAIEDHKNTATVGLAQAMCFDGAGYKANTNSSWQSYWKSYWFYRETAQPKNETYSWPNIISSAMAFGVTKNDTKSYQHVMNYNSTFAKWEVYNEDWLHTLKSSNVDTLTANNWFSQTSSGRSTGLTFEKSMPLYDGRNPGYDSNLRYMLMAQRSAALQNTTNTGGATSYKIPRIGLVSSNVLATSIYQDKDGITQLVDNTEHKSNRNNLMQGFILGYANYGDKIMWEPVFKNMSSTMSGFITSSTEVVVRFSIVPFGENYNTSGSTTNNWITVKKVNGSSSSTTAPTTIDKKVKVEFEMPEDGFIYVKFYPSGKTDSQLSGNQWQVDLDLDNSSYYYRTPASD